MDLKKTVSFRKNINQDWCRFRVVDIIAAVANHTLHFSISQKNITFLRKKSIENL